MGQGFAYWAARYGPTHRRHHPTCPDGTPFKQWRPSEMTGSDKLARLYEQQEILTDLLRDWNGEDVEELADALRSAAEVAGEVGQEYTDADEAMGGHGGENSDRADECDTWASELEIAADSLAPFDASSSTDEDDLESWKEEQITIVEDVVGSLGL